MKRPHTFTLLILLITFTAATLVGCSKPKECRNPVSRDLTVNAAFTEVAAGEQFILSISKGNTTAIRATGCIDDLNDLRAEIVNDKVYIHYDRFKSGRYKMYLNITLPSITGFELSGQAEATISGFSDLPALNGITSGEAICDVNVTGTTIDLQSSGQSNINVFGVADRAWLEVSGQAAIHAYGLHATDTDVSASGQAQAWVYATRRIRGRADGQSTIWYKGNAGTSFITNGQARVIRQ